MIELRRISQASDKGARSCRRPRTPARIQRLVLALLLVMAGTSAALARDDIDPLHSPQCGAAQAALERAMQEAEAGSEAAKQALGADRRQALEACLGPQTGHDQRNGAPSIPIEVHSPALAPREGRAVAPQVISPPSPPVNVARPVPITICDTGGCWDSQGHRLNFMGPVLTGPHGVCTTQAGTVQCPQ